MDVTDLDFRAARDRLHRRELLAGLYHIFGPIDGELMAAHRGRGGVAATCSAARCSGSRDSPSDRLFFIITGRVAIIARACRMEPKSCEYHMGARPGARLARFPRRPPQTLSRPRGARHACRGLHGREVRPADRAAAPAGPTDHRRRGGADRCSERLLPPARRHHDRARRGERVAPTSRVSRAAFERRWPDSGACCTSTKARVEQMLTEPGIADRAERLSGGATASGLAGRVRNPAPLRDPGGGPVRRRTGRGAASAAPIACCWSRARRTRTSGVSGSAPRRASRRRTPETRWS